MKKLLVFVLIMLLSVNVWAVPTTLISIPNTFSSQTTISSSETNANNSEIGTKYNSHSHTDITEVGTLTTGTWNASSISGTYLTFKGMTTTDTSTDDVWAVTKSGNGTVFDIDKTGTGEGIPVDINNAGIGESIKVVQTGADHAVTIDQSSNSAGMKITIATGTSESHITFVPVATVVTSSEGSLYADDDGILYYRSNTGMAACNAATDFGEIMECEGDAADYEVGDVISIGKNNISRAEYESTLIDKKTKKKKKKTIDGVFSPTTKNVEKSSKPYDTSIIGVVSDRAGYVLDPNMPINDNRIVVGLIGLVKCKVNNEGGNIKPGDLLVSSSTDGVAMKGTIDSFDKIGSVVGKARESFNGTSGIIEIAVGVK